MLEVRDLHVTRGDTKILKGIDLTVKEGEVHAIMGPNGSGKSTLSKVIAGHPDYTISSGSIKYEINFKMKDLLELEPDERAREGVFLAFQYPIEIPGVSNFEFLRAAFNSISSHQGGSEMDVLEFQDYLNSKLSKLKVDSGFMSREVNVDFSGGEKKRNEILQMAVLNPRLSLLDEIDSGLDIDALREVASGINLLKDPSNALILITHYERILEYVVPNFIHILYDGKIIKSGTADLAREIEDRGYEHLIS